MLTAVRRGRIYNDEWPRICTNLEALPIEIEPLSTPGVGARCSLSAERHDLSIYDATYLELGLRMRLPLATLDRALAAAAKTAGVDTPATL